MRIIHLLFSQHNRLVLNDCLGHSGPDKCPLLLNLPETPPTAPLCFQVSKTLTRPPAIPFIMEIWRALGINK